MVLLIGVASLTVAGDPGGVRSPRRKTGMIVRSDRLPAVGSMRISGK
jgi:hypothetical protein